MECLPSNEGVNGPSVCVDVQYSLPEQVASAGMRAQNQGRLRAMRLTYQLRAAAAVPWVAAVTQAAVAWLWRLHQVPPHQRQEEGEAGRQGVAGAAIMLRYRPAPSAGAAVRRQRGWQQHHQAEAAVQGSYR